MQGSSICNMRDERNLKFHNRRCRYGRKAEVMISDSVDNPYKLFFRCRLKNCGFFECWNLEDDNPVNDDEVEGVLSYGRQQLARNRLNVEDVCEINVRNYGGDNIRGLKMVVKILCCCVFMLAITVIFK